MNEGILYSLATIAATLAGFSGVVVVFRRQAVQDWSATERRYLWFLIGDSFLVIFFSLLPVPLMLAGLTHDQLWATSSVLFGAWFFLATGIALFGEVKDRRAGRSSAVTFVTTMLNVLSVPAVLMGIALWLSAAGVLPRGQAIYVFGLLLLLATGALEFMFFVARASSKPEKKETPAPTSSEL